MDKTGKKQERPCIDDTGHYCGPCVENECEVFQTGGSWERCYFGGLRLASEIGVEKLKKNMEEDGGP